MIVRPKSMPAVTPPPENLFRSTHTRRTWLRPGPAAALRALRQAHARGVRMVSICSGVFALAEAGLLDGLTVTTNWRAADLLARRHPEVTVNPDVLYLDHGQILTSAGASAGLDLCLHVVRRDHGALTANTAARFAVAAPHRVGGRNQCIKRATPQRPLARTREWALRRLGEELPVPGLARHAAMSERTFARRFVEEVGVSPTRWLPAARIDLARQLLESGDTGIDEIARRVGLGTTANFRARFRKATGTSPTAYRRTFSAPSRVAEDALRCRHARHSGRTRFGRVRGCVRWGEAAGTGAVRRHSASVPR